MAQTDVISVSAVENVLGRIIRVHSQPTIIVLGYTDLLQTGEATHRLAGVILHRVEARDLQR